MTLTERMTALEEKLDMLILLSTGGKEFNYSVDYNETVSLNDRIVEMEKKFNALIEHLQLREYNGIKYEKQPSSNAIMGFNLNEIPDE